MRASHLGVSLALILVPCLALAAGAGPSVLNLRDGIPAELLNKTMGIAKGLFALSLVIGLLLEAFGGSPIEQKDYAGVVWRAMLVVALLSGYRMVFGTVINTCQSIADRIAPQDVYAAFGEQNLKSIQSLNERSKTEDSAKPEGMLSGMLPSSTLVKGYVGGALFDGLVLVLVAAGQALHWAFTHLTRILIALLYILGPLALVFHIPRTSDTARRWFRNFVTIATWPIFSALLLAISASLLLRTDKAAVLGEYATAFGALATTVLMVVMCLATPLLAAASVGGSLKNVPVSSLMEAAFGVGAAARMGRGVLGNKGEEAERIGRGVGRSGVEREGNNPDAAHGAPTVAMPPTDGSAIREGLVGEQSTAPMAAVPSAVAVPLAAEAASEYVVNEPTVAGGRGHRQGPGSFAGAWRLPKVGGLDSKALRVEQGANAAADQPSPLSPKPKNFDSKDWGDVGR